jgi:hypothetical protein
VPYGEENQVPDCPKEVECLQTACDAQNICNAVCEKGQCVKAMCD